MPSFFRSLSFVFAVSTSIVLLSACSGTRPQEIGVHEGQLAPCPSSPNCVNSRTNNTDHAIKPIAFKQAVPQTEAMRIIKEAVMSLPRTEIITATPTYLYAEATSKIMRFVDDVEFLFPEQEQITEVHVRSASRKGYRDFGVNRERIEQVRAKVIEMGLGRR